MVVTSECIGILFGGRTEKALLGDCWTVDFSLTPLVFKRVMFGKGKVPTRRFGHSFTYLPQHHAALVVGGISDRGEMTDCHLLDVATMKWRALELSLPCPLGYHRAVYHQGSVLTHGGRTANGQLTSDLLKITVELERLEPKANAIPPVKDLSIRLSPSTSALSPRKSPRKLESIPQIIKPGRLRVVSAKATPLLVVNPGAGPSPRMLHTATLCADDDTLVVSGGQRTRAHRLLPPIADDVFCLTLSTLRWRQLHVPFPRRFHHAALTLSTAHLGNVPCGAIEGVCFVGGLPFDTDRPFFTYLSLSSVLGRDGASSSPFSVSPRAIAESWQDPSERPQHQLLLGNCFSVDILRHPTVGTFRPMNDLELMETESLPSPSVMRAFMLHDSASSPPASPKSKFDLEVLGATGMLDIKLEKKMARKYLLPWLMQVRKRLRLKRRQAREAEERRIKAAREAAGTTGNSGGEEASPALPSVGEELTTDCLCCASGKMTHIVMPCGHLALCQHCSVAALRCPLCNSLLSDTKEAVSGKLPFVHELVVAYHHQDYLYERREKQLAEARRKYSYHVPLREQVSSIVRPLSSASTRAPFSTSSLKSPAPTRPFGALVDDPNLLINAIGRAGSPYRHPISPIPKRKVHTKTPIINSRRSLRAPFGSL